MTTDKRQTWKRPTVGQATRLIIRWDRIIGSIALGLAVGIILVVGMMIGDSLATQQTTTLQPCATEDSTDCYWDAESRGNGDGIPFIDMGGVTYVPLCTDALADAGGACIGEP